MRNITFIDGLALFITFLLLCSTLAGCGKRLAIKGTNSTEQGGTNIEHGTPTPTPSPDDKDACIQNLTGSLVKHEPALQTFYEGDEVLWEIKINNACSNRLIAIIPSVGILNLSERKYFAAQYPVGTHVQKMRIIAVNSEGNSLKEIDVESPPFTVLPVPQSPRLGCELSVSPTTVDAAVDASGTILGTRPSFNFTLSGKLAENTVTSQVVSFIAPNAGQVTTTIPTANAGSHSIQYVPQKSGEHALSFRIVDAANVDSIAVCGPVLVNVVGLQIAAPTVTVTVTTGGNQYSGTVRIPYNSNASLEYSSQYAESCSVKKDGNNTGWTDKNRIEQLTGLISDTTYAVTCTGLGGLTTTQSITLDVETPPAPATPTGLRATILSSTSIRLNWNDTTAEVGYRVFIKDAASISKLADLAAGVVEYTVNELGANRVYEFRIEAFNTHGSNNSAWLSVTTPALPTLDVKVDNQQGPITVGYNATVNVTWTSTNAVTCTQKINGGTSTGVNLQNTAGTSYGPLTAKGEFEVTCVDSYSQTVSDKVIANVNPPPGQWYQVYNTSCELYCGLLSKNNVADAAGHRCASGELIPASLPKTFVFPWGCWPDCSVHGAINGHVVFDGGTWCCYGDSQKQDDDGTDIVTACYCR